MEYDRDDYLWLSGIQHYMFCRRQWALIDIEQQWNENTRTLEGRLLHERTHDATFTEKRKNVIISRAMPIHSPTLGASGECDVVEFVRNDESGVPINGREGKYTLCPVEYKRGKPKDGDEDVYQLAAQAICLEEMFCCEVNEGYLFYFETNHRLKVDLNDELKADVRSAFCDMHRMYDRKYTPKVKVSKSCNACSLKGVCLPVLNSEKSAKLYISDNIKKCGDDI